MNQLRTYLASLNSQEQAAFARKAGTSIGYLRKALCIGQRFGGVLARRLDEASNGAISRHSLRPDIFGPSPAARSSFPVHSVSEGIGVPVGASVQVGGVG